LQLPNIATAIWDGNKQLALAPTPSLRRINLESVIIGNGLTDPYVHHDTS
jgi:cathepsin A (carboxypeptidase C)